MKTVTEIAASLLGFANVTWTPAQPQAGGSNTTGTPHARLIQPHCGVRAIKAGLFLATLSVACVMSAATAREAVKLSPEAKTAYAAQLAAHPGAKPAAVAATGSMKPTLDEGWFVLIEAVPYHQLKDGDIVAVKTEDCAYMHRLVNRTTAGWRTRGDACEREDPWTVTRDTLVGRAVVAINRTTGEIKNL